MASDGTAADADDDRRRHSGPADGPAPIDAHHIIPRLLEEFRASSLRRRRTEQSLVLLRSALLLAAATGGLIDLIVKDGDSRIDVGGVIVLFAFFASSVVARWAMENDPEKAPEKLAAAGEVAESYVWRYAMCASPTEFELNDERATAVYVARLQEIGEQLFAYGAPTSPLVTEQMRALRASDLAARRDAYLEVRIAHAHAQLLEQTHAALRSARRWKVFAVLAEFGGVAGGILKASSFTSLDLLGFAGVLVASIAMWVESADYERTARTSAAKSEMLAAARESARHINREERWSAFVAEIEDKLTLDSTAVIGRTTGHQFRADLQADLKQMSAENYFGAIRELRERLLKGDAGKSKFEPDVVVAVNPGGAIVGGILYFMTRGYDFFPVSLKAGLSDAQVRQLLSWVLEDARPRETGALKILVLDASMKSGGSFAKVVPVLRELVDEHPQLSAPATAVEIRTAVLAYRPDLSADSREGMRPDYFIDSATDSFPYGGV